MNATKSEVIISGPGTLIMTASATNDEFPNNLDIAKIVGKLMAVGAANPAVFEVECKPRSGTDGQIK